MFNFQDAYILSLQSLVLISQHMLCHVSEHPRFIIIIIIIIIHCNIGGSHSCVDLGSRLTGCYLTSNGSADVSKDGSPFVSKQLQSLITIYQ